MFKCSERRHRVIEAAKMEGGVKHSLHQVTFLVPKEDTRWRYFNLKRYVFSKIQKLHEL